MVMTKYRTVTDIKWSNREGGFHFFDRSTMRFFDSKVERGVYQGKGGVFFITSEQFHGSNGSSEPRKWTVRQFDTGNGDVSTVTEYNTIPSLAEARAAAKLCASGLVETVKAKYTKRTVHNVTGSEVLS